MTRDRFTLDGIADDRDGSWWDSFFADRARPCPFLVDVPDENLVDWIETGRINPGRALELGCGNGRNATYLAGQGFAVDAIDFSGEAIEWARSRTGPAAVAYQCCSIFDAILADDGYELVYDSGCFHHLAPHLRPDYVELVDRALKPGGRFGLVCFRPEGGSGLSDHEVYEQRSLGGGLGYSEEQLRRLWCTGSTSVEVLRAMAQQSPGAPVFGQEFLWALLAAKQYRAR